MKKLLIGNLALCLSLSDGFGGDLSSLIEEWKPDELPGVSIAVLKDGKVLGVGVAGQRHEEGGSVEMEDRFHIGSCTKSMTATLAAVLVEEEKIEWDTTVSEIFEAWEIHEAYRGVTLEQLLSHQGGFSPNSSPEQWRLAWEMEEKGNLSTTARRRNFVKGSLLTKPAGQAGKYLYSNLGYSVAGLMLEEVSGESWEALMKEKIFDPLEMKHSGFGAPATEEKPEQPWGHDKSGKAQRPGLGDDNPSSIGPAGQVHCSSADLARYVQMHLTKELGPVLKNESSFTKLHTGLVDSGGRDSQYALGWIATERTWGKGGVLHHAGSNTFFFTNIWIAPETGFAVIINTNQGGDKTAMLADQLVGKAVKRWGTSSD